jgi:predicted dehydrogenase
MPSMQRTRPPSGWGLIGGSGFAGSTPGPAILAAEGARLAAILSRDPREARRALRWMSGWDLAQRYAGPWLANKLRYSRLACRLDALRRLGMLAHRRVTVVDDPERFLADPEVEAVWVASPPYLHAEQVIAALERGKHVLCEKPLATTPAEARAMIEAARRAGRRLAVGYHMRQHPAHRALWRACRDGALGRIESFRATLHFRHPDPRPWHRIKALSGGWAVCEAGTHLVDLALWFLGDAVVAVEAELSNMVWGFETDDRARVTIRFEGGAVADLDISAAAEAPGQWFEVVGTEGRARCVETMFGQAGTLRRAARDGAEQVEPVPPVDPYKLQVESFVAALRGDPEALVVSAEVGLKNLEIIERARGW